MDSPAAQLIAPQADSLSASGPASPESNRSLPSSIASSPVQPKRTKAKKGHAKRPFIPDWYNKEEIYQFTTLYNKIGVEKMEAFLAVEGVDIAVKFPRRGGTFYDEQAGKCVKINRGHALAFRCQIVHQRVIDRMRVGHAVGPNMAPHLGANDWSADGDEESDAGEVQEQQEQEEGQEEQQEQNDGDESIESDSEVFFTHNAPAVQLPASGSSDRRVSPPKAVQKPGPPVPVHREGPDSVVTDKTRKNLKAIKAEFQKALGESRNEGRQASTSAEGNNQQVLHQEEPKWIVRDETGAPLVSIQAQKLVHRIVELQAGLHHRYVHGTKRDRAGHHKFRKDWQGMNNEYQSHRSALMAELWKGVSWECGVDGAKKAANLVGDVFPVGL